MKKQHLAFSFILSLCICSVSLPGRLPQAQASQVGAQAKASNVQLAGLRGSVTVRRDERGIPYIEAENEEDLYLTQGYVVASDRLWQMDLLRRTARGELAEIFGRPALEEDKRRRSFGYFALAEQMTGRLSPQSLAALKAYARGVNSFIESLDEKSMPREFRVLGYKPRPWSPADSLLIGKVFAETLSGTWHLDLMRAAMSNLPQEKQDMLFPVISPLDVIVVGSDKKKAEPAKKAATARLPEPPSLAMLESASEITETMRRSLDRVGVYAEDLAASNNWVVSAKRTVTGKPLLANDPHLSASVPSIWYMVHLSAPGLRIAGVTAPGHPDVLIGHNERIAWGITNVEADVQDLYAEKFDKDNPRRYMTPSGWREAAVRHEEIKVRKSFTSPETETVGLDITVTRHGPIILDGEGVRYALAWPALDPTTVELESFYSMNRAKNWQEFRAALSRYTGFPLNYVYADVDGHIGYWAAGRYPIRKTGHGRTPYDGATDAGEWTGYVPFEATPNLYDPPSGVIVTANNRIVGLDYAHHLGDSWAAPYRARRIHDLLMAKKKLSVEDFRVIQGDTYSFPDATFIGEVVKIGKPLAASSNEWREIITAFDGWDALMKADSRLMPIAVMMRDLYQRRILAGALGPELARRYAWANSGTFYDQIITTRPKEWLPKEFASYEALLLASYKDALTALKTRLGEDRAQWTWGRMSQVRFVHPLASAPLIGTQFAIDPVPQNGGGPTVNRGSSVSMRYIADLSNWDNTRQGITLGASGNPASPHWKDQLADWQAVTPRVFPFSKNAITGAAKEVTVFASSAAQ